MVKIITDSTSDISQEMGRELGVTVIPLWVHFGKEEYQDGVTLYPAEFYAKLVKDKTFPTTAAPPPGLFAEAYDRLARETDEILCLVISAKYSATYDAAMEGKELQKRKDCRVEIIDTLTAIGGQGLLTAIAAEEAKRGANLDQIMDMIQRSIPKTYTRFCLDTLEYLHRGGRIGTAQAFLGSMLRFKPIIGIIDGYTEGVARVRSHTKAIDWLYNFVKGFSNIRALAVEYSTIPENAETLAQRLGSIFPVDKIHRSIFSPVIGSHVGPRAIGIALVEQV